MKLKNLTEQELDLNVYRYLTFPKFLSMLTYQAVWFSKLRILQDEFEGTMPPLVEEEMTAGHQQFKKHFDPAHHGQIDDMAKRNVKDGRELTLVSCWFLGDTESEQMWKEYSDLSQGVAVKSTVRKLTRYVFAWPDVSHIGKVQYVDLSTHRMTMYEASQPHERAFLKSTKYSHEKEIRITTMSFKHTHCVSPDGVPYTQEECSGKNMNNFENPGLYVGVNFAKLVDAVILAPQAAEWTGRLIKRIFAMSKLDIAIQKSKLTAQINQASLA